MKPKFYSDYDAFFLVLKKGRDYSRWCKYHIRNLKAHSVIERVGPDKGGFWKVKDE